MKGYVLGSDFISSKALHDDAIIKDVSQRVVRLIKWMFFIKINSNTNLCTLVCQVLYRRRAFHLFGFPAQLKNQPLPPTRCQAHQS